MKHFFVVLALLTTFLTAQVDTYSSEGDNLFSTKGTVTHINTQEKVLLVKREGGLELTFHTDEATEVTVDGEMKSIADIGINDSVEIDYVYNENYEKVARKIRKTSGQ